MSISEDLIGSVSISEDLIGSVRIRCLLSVLAISRLWLTMCVCCTTIVLTLGMSMPFSMMVVATITSISPSVKATMRPSSWATPE